MKLIAGTMLGGTDQRDICTLQLWRDGCTWHYRVTYGMCVHRFDTFDESKRLVQKLGYAVPKTLQFADGVTKEDKRQLWPDGKATNK